MDLTNQEQKLFDILTNKNCYKPSCLDDHLFNSDIIISLTIPSNELDKPYYLPRNKQINLTSFLNTPNQHLMRAYQAAIEKLYDDMKRVGDQLDKNGKQLMTRLFSSISHINKPKNSSQKSKSEEGLKSDNEKKSESLRNLHPVQLQNNRPKKGQKNSSASPSMNKNGQNSIDIQSDPAELDPIKTIYIKETNDSQPKLTNIETPFRYQNSIDGFTIILNALIYALVVQCGFQVFPFIRQSTQSRIPFLSFLPFLKKKVYKVYLCLFLKQENLIKAANKFGIKKQIYYEYIDPDLNIPLDSKNRPLKVHSQIKKQTQKMLENGDFYINHKKTLRKLGIDIGLSQDYVIYKQSFLNIKQKSRYIKFIEEYDILMYKLVGSKESYNCFNDPYDQDAITPEEKMYLHQINRGKVNDGVIKEYVKKKKQRKYIEEVKKLASRHGFKTYDQPIVFAEFMLSSKNKSFFQRLDTSLLFKEQIYTPYGDFTLFNNMQKIKVSYLILREKISINGLQLFNIDYFSLNNSYQRDGKSGDEKTQKFYHVYDDEKRKKIDAIKGGLNGRNLRSDWNRLFIWRTNFVTLRNYLGEQKTFQVFVKTYLTLIFLLLAPIGILFTIIYQEALESSDNVGLTFYIVFFVLSFVLMYSIFLSKYQSKEKVFFKDFFDEKNYKTLRHDYRGPYVRDMVGDFANDYQNRSFKDKFFSFLSLVIVFLCFGIVVGFYYAMRFALIDVYYNNPDGLATDVFFIHPLHLLCYSIYFIGNGIFYSVFLRPLAYALTKKQNRPTLRKFNQSLNTKLYIFRIGAQLIGPIDLVFIQTTAKTQCFASDCYRQLELYVHCRYLIILGFVFIQLLLLIVQYFVKRTLDKTQDLINMRNSNSQEKGINMPYVKKMEKFLQYMIKEEQLQSDQQVSFVDETVALTQLCTFIFIFPLAPAISLLSMFLDSIIDRENTIGFQRRRIQKGIGCDIYYDNLQITFHWMILFNISIIFIQQSFIEIFFPQIILAIEETPTPASVLIIKYAAVIIFVLIFQIIGAIGKAIGRKTQSLIENRKMVMVDKAFKQRKKIKKNISGKKIETKHVLTISRTYNTLEEESQSQLTEQRPQKK